MAVRIALQCSEADAHLILSKENGEARLLSRPGEAIYNAANGLLEGNNLFQIVFISDERRDEYLAVIEEQAEARARAPRVKLSSKALHLRIFRKTTFWPAGVRGKERLGGTACWLGESVAIKDPTVALFRSRAGPTCSWPGRTATPLSA